MRWLCSDGASLSWVEPRGRLGFRRLCQHRVTDHRQRARRDAELDGPQNSTHTSCVLEASGASPSLGYLGCGPSFTSVTLMLQLTGALRGGAGRGFSSTSKKRICCLCPHHQVSLDYTSFSELEDGATWLQVFDEPCVLGSDGLSVLTPLLPFILFSFSFPSNFRLGKNIHITIWISVSINIALVCALRNFKSNYQIT